MSNIVSYKRSLKIRQLNVLMNNSGRACLTDFGLALVRTDKTLAHTVAASTAQGFSSRWAAPELLDEGVRASKASDVWAVGCVCYEVRRFLAGRLMVVTQIQIDKGSHRKTAI